MHRGNTFWFWFKLPKLSKPSIKISSHNIRIYITTWHQDVSRPVVLCFWILTAVDMVPAWTEPPVSRLYFSRFHLFLQWGRQIWHSVSYDMVWKGYGVPEIFLSLVEYLLVGCVLCIKPMWSECYNSVLVPPSPSPLSRHGMAHASELNFNF